MLYRDLPLDRFQEEAIRHLHEGSSVLVSAPTGTGKTIIADWIVEEALKLGKQVIYTAPIKALSNQKFRDYTRLHGAEKVGLVTGDLVIRRDAPCLVMTTEILRNMLLSGERLEHLHAVILDEIHFLDDVERGTTWEEVLIYLPQQVQIVGLSATLSNLGELAEWLRFVRERKVEVVTEHQRTVPLTFLCASEETGLMFPSEFAERARKRADNPRAQEQTRGRGGRDDRGRGGRDRGGRGGKGGREGRPQRHVSRTSHVDLFKMIRDENLLPYLYFAFSRKDTEAFARQLARYVRESLLDAEEQARMDLKLASASIELGAALDQDLRSLYARGIAFHHAGVHVQLKALVEELYEEKLVKVLYCTSTFALGINMPARSVAFDALEKFDGRAISPLTTRQFMQKAGRAGRRGMDTAGHVIMRMDLEQWEQYRPQLERYKKNAYEPVKSSFNLSWNSVVNLLARHDEARIREILSKSFLSWHLQREAEGHLRRALMLEKAAGTSKSEVSTRNAKEARRLRKRAGSADDHVWNEFSRKVTFLRDAGYVSDENGFNAGANVLRHLHVAEIPMTELVLSGQIERLDAATLFGVLCAVSSELPRAASRNYWLKREDKRLAADLEEVVRGGVVAGAAELTGSPWTWEPDLIPLGRLWAEGHSLQELLLMVESGTDISGDLITGFRRAKDLAGQLLDVYAQIPERVQLLRELIRTVSRDEVEVVD